MNVEETLTRRELARRRQLATHQLLEIYRREHLRQLTALGNECETLVALPGGNALTESQKNVLTTRYDEFLKSQVEVQKVAAAELQEMEGFGIPVVGEERVVVKESRLTFSQTEGFVSRQLSVVLGSSRLEPHLSTTSAMEDSKQSVEKKEEEKGKAWNEEKREGLRRLEAFACSACFREMDREDYLIALLGPRGKYSIRRTAFVIGCTPQLKEEQEKQPKVETPLSLDVSSHIGRSNDSAGMMIMWVALTVCAERKADGELGKGRGLMKVDVDLSTEGCSSDEVEIDARVWLRPDGVFCIESTDVREVKLDQVQVSCDEPAVLRHLSMIEVDNVPLLVLINRNGVNRVQKKSRIEINI